MLLHKYSPHWYETPMEHHHNSSHLNIVYFMYIDMIQQSISVSGCNMENVKGNEYLCMRKNDM